MPRYLDPKSDLVFKKIFGGHPVLLKSFLNAVLPLPAGCLIDDLEYLSSENIPEIPEFKHSVVDVRCFDQEGRHFIVEMQMSWSKHFMQRLLFNTASVYVRQLKTAENYRELNPVYGLAIVADAFSEEIEWLHHYQLRHTKNSKKIIDGIQLVLLELPKFKPKTIAEKKLTVLWLRFLTEINEQTQTVDQELLEVPEIKQALALTEESAYTPKELEAYERNWDAIRSEKTMMEDKWEEGRKEGMQVGLIHVAKNLLKGGFELSVIAQNTGLSMEVLEKLKAETKKN